MKGLKKSAVIVAVGLATWGFAAQAEAATAKREGVKASVSDAEVDAWSGVTVCDTKADGNSVYSQYYRDRGGMHTVSAAGNGNCSFGGEDIRNLVRQFNACNNLSFRPDPCTDPTYR